MAQLSVLLGLVSQSELISASILLKEANSLSVELNKGNSSLASKTIFRCVSKTRKLERFGGFGLALLVILLVFRCFRRFFPLCYPNQLAVLPEYTPREPIDGRSVPSQGQRSARLE